MVRTSKMLMTNTVKLARNAPCYETPLFPSPDANPIQTDLLWAATCLAPPTATMAGSRPPILHVRQPPVTIIWSQNYWHEHHLSLAEYHQHIDQLFLKQLLWEIKGILKFVTGLWDNGFHNQISTLQICEQNYNHIFDIPMYAIRNILYVVIIT